MNVATCSTDNLRQLADDMDADGQALDGFVLVAVQADQGGRVLVLGSMDDTAAMAQVLRLWPSRCCGEGVSIDPD